MKKLLFVVATLLLCSSQSFAQKEVSKRDVKKEAKVSYKAARKEGWLLLGSGTMQKAFYDHEYDKQTRSLMELTNIAEDKVSVNLAKTIVDNATINEYARRARAAVRGKAVSELRDINGSQVDNLLEGYERLLVAEVGGELRPTITLYRKNKSDKYDVKRFYLIDFDEVYNANIRALKRAVEESEWATKYADQITQWINESFVRDLCQ